MTRHVYADNAATTKMSQAAIDTMVECMNDIYGNPSSIHSIGKKAKSRLEKSRFEIAKMINAHPDEILFTSGGSEADNQALLSVAKIGMQHGKNKIISTAIEHHAILNILSELSTDGFNIVLLPVQDNGIVDIDMLKQSIDDTTCLVTIMSVNNEIGTIQPIAQIGEICRQKCVLFHTDAVQAVGHIPIDVKTQKIDLLSASAHKFHGANGVGFLYVRRGIPLTNLIIGGEQEHGNRAGTENIAGIAAMETALRDSLAEMNRVNTHVTTMREYIIDNLVSIPHCVLNGDRVQRVSNNINFCFEGISGDSLLLALDSKGICASSGSACTSGSSDPSHVLVALGRTHELANAAIRLSLNDDITIEDADYIIASIIECVQQLREYSPVWHDLMSGKKTFTI